jgi:hypothetical protein
MGVPCFSRSAFSRARAFARYTASVSRERPWCSISAPCRACISTWPSCRICISPDTISRSSLMSLSDATRRILSFFRPPCRDGLAGYLFSLPWRQCSGASMAALGGSKLRQGNGGRVPHIWHFGRSRSCASRLLDDLPGELIGIARSTWSSRHEPSIARRTDDWAQRRNRN